MCANDPNPSARRCRRKLPVRRALKLARRAEDLGISIEPWIPLTWRGFKNDGDIKLTGGKKAKPVSPRLGHLSWRSRGCAAWRRPAYDPVEAAVGPDGLADHAV